jgi:hypothetical protein
LRFDSEFGKSAMNLESFTVDPVAVICTHRCDD